MDYKLLYKCKNCYEIFSEVLSEEELRNVFGNRCGCENKDCDIMSTDFLATVFRLGLEMHKCPNDWTSYGDIIAIKPIED